MTAAALSPIDLLAREHPEKLRRLSNREITTLHYDWPMNARANQLPPSGDWRDWLVQAGRRVIGAGIFAAALFYGDAIITPAISVLSAVEGISVATPQFEHFVVPITVSIIVALFCIQRFGTGRVGAADQLLRPRRAGHARPGSGRQPLLPAGAGLVRPAAGRARHGGRWSPRWASSWRSKCCSSPPT